MPAKTVKVKNLLNQLVRTLVWNEETSKFVERSLQAKEVADINEKLSSLTEQQILNGALKLIAA
jgi:hypothetical protein